MVGVVVVGVDYGDGLGGVGGWCVVVVVFVVGGVVIWFVVVVVLGLEVFVGVLDYDVDGVDVVWFFGSLV